MDLVFLLLIIIQRLKYSNIVLFNGENCSILVTQNSNKT